MDTQGTWVLALIVAGASAVVSLAWVARGLVPRALVRGRCVDGVCTVSIRFSVRNALGLRGSLRRSINAYAVASLVGGIDYLRGYLPSINNTWGMVGPEVEVKVVGTLLGKERGKVVGLVFHRPTAAEFPWGIIPSFDPRTGEPVGAVGMVDLRELLIERLGEDHASVIDLAEAVRGTKVHVSFLGIGPGAQGFSFFLDKLLGLCGYYVGREVALVRSSDVVEVSRIRCVDAFDVASCLGALLRVTWGWLALATLASFALYLLGAGPLVSLVPPLAYAASLALAMGLT